MKKNARDIKSVKRGVTISAVTTVLLFAGLIIQYINTGLWDTAGSGLLACNAAILTCCMAEYEKAAKSADLT